MSDHNPYTPPAAQLADLPAPRSRMPRYALAGLILVHLLLLANALPMLWRLLSLAAILGFAGWWIARPDAARMESAEAAEQA